VSEYEIKLAQRQTTFQEKTRSENKEGPTYLCSSTCPSTRLVTSRLRRAEAASRDSCLLGD